MNRSPHPLATTDLSVVTHLGKLKRRYSRLMLISHRRHLVYALEAGPDTLVYTTDWLTWRLCIDAGLDAVHFEGLLDTWPDERGDPSEAHRHSWEWVYVDGKDVTLFDGVSLGKLFVRNISWVCHAFSRQWHALDRACVRWHPTEIVLHDLRAELDLLDAASVETLVRQVAHRHGTTLVVQRDMPPSGDPGLPDHNDGYGIPKSDQPVKKFLRNALSELLDATCRVRDFFRPRSRKVLIVSNWSTVRGLLDAFAPSGPVRPAAVIGHLPKRPAALWSWIVRGVTLVGHPYTRLSNQDRIEVDKICEIIKASWTQPVVGAPAMLRDFVRQNILDAGWLHLQALETRRWRRLLQRHRPERVVVGDATNSLCRLIAEVACSEGALVDELLNGMFMTPQRYDARVGDRGYPAPIGRLLSWGEQNKDWLNVTGAPLEYAVTGYPALDSLRAGGKPYFSRCRALVLPLYVDCDDVLGLWGNIFTHLVATVDALTRFGCREIRVKVHPGPFNARYYSDVLQHFGLSAQIISSGSLEPHLEWTDFVVGPVNSGAYVESLALGKPYYPMHGTPSLIDNRLIGPIKCYFDAESVIAALGSGQAPEATAAGEYLASLLSVPNAGRKAWMVLNGDGASPGQSAQYKTPAMKVAAQ